MKCNALTPMLETRDMAGTIHFYKEILGFEITGSFEVGDKTVWCEFRRDNAVLAYSLPNAVINYPALMLSGSLYINVESVDEFWAVLKDKCEIVYGIENFKYGMREFAIKDNNGYVINFGEELPWE